MKIALANFFLFSAAFVIKLLTSLLKFRLKYKAFIRNWNSFTPHFVKDLWRYQMQRKWIFYYQDCIRSFFCAHFFQIFSQTKLSFFNRAQQVKPHKTLPQPGAGEPFNKLIRWIEFDLLVIKVIRFFKTIDICKKSILKTNRGCLFTILSFISASNLANVEIALLHSSQLLMMTGNIDCFLPRNDENTDRSVPYKDERPHSFAIPQLHPYWRNVSLSICFEFY